MSCCGPSGECLLVVPPDAVAVVVVVVGRGENAAATMHHDVTSTTRGWDRTPVDPVDHHRNFHNHLHPQLRDVAP
jgi:hypothetical protein